VIIDGSIEVWRAILMIVRRQFREIVDYRLSSAKTYKQKARERERERNRESDFLMLYSIKNLIKLDKIRKKIKEVRSLYTWKLS